MKNGETGDFKEQSGSKVGQVNRHLRRSYDANFKIVEINTVEDSGSIKTV